MTLIQIVIMGCMSNPSSFISNSHRFTGSLLDRSNPRLYAYPSEPTPKVCLANTFDMAVTNSEFGIFEQSHEMFWTRVRYGLFQHTMKEHQETAVLAFGSVGSRSRVSFLPPSLRKTGSLPLFRCYCVTLNRTTLALTLSLFCHDQESFHSSMYDQLRLRYSIIYDLCFRNETTRTMAFGFAWTGDEIFKRYDTGERFLNDEAVELAY